LRHDGVNQVRLTAAAGFVRVSIEPEEDFGSVVTSTGISVALARRRKRMGI